MLVLYGYGVDVQV